MDKVIANSLRDFALVATSYRVVGLLISMAGILGSRSLRPRELRQLLVVATAAGLTNVGFVAAGARSGAWPRKETPVICADVALATACNVWAAGVVPRRSLFDDYRDLFWVYAGGTAALWTGVCGRQTGLKLLVGCFLPLQLGMAARNGISPRAIDKAKFVSRSLWLTAAFLVGDRVISVAPRSTAAVAAEADRRAAESERQRIAAELHDAVKNGLTRIALQARGGASRTDSEVAKRFLESIGAEAERALREMRGLLKLLHADDARPAPVGLEGLAELVENVGRAGLQVDARIEGEIASLPPSISWSAFRIVGEALTNASAMYG